MGDFDENKAIKKIIEKIDGRYLDEKYKPTHKGYDFLKNFLLILTIFSLAYSGYSWVKIQGKNEAKLETLFQDGNPIVKHKELTNVEKAVRHDMITADQAIINKLNTVVQSQDERKKEFKDFKKEIKTELNKNTDRIIDIIKSQNK